jgi:PAS domain S-box-containing protein
MGDTPAKKTPKTVVFADNDVLLLEAIPELLRTKGLDVYPARDGLEALQAIRKLKPSYVILDIVMPKIDGSRVCWLVRQEPNLRDTPIIAFSALGPQDIRRFPELSADAYVAKGPLGIVVQNILLAMKYVDDRGRGGFEGGIFGYEGFHPRKIISEMVLSKRHWEGLMRAFGAGVLELDQDGRILMANAGASEILGKKEIHLIAESLPSLFPARDRQVIQEMLNEVKKARLPEEFQMVVSVRSQELSLRFSSIVEEGECMGIVVTLEPRQLKATAAK